MSLLFATGFGLTTTPTDLFGATSALGASIGAYGRNGGAGMRVFPQFGNRQPRMNLGANAAKVCVHVAFQVNVAGAVANVPVFRFLDNGTVQVQMTLDLDGTLHFTGTASTLSINPALYNHVYVEWTIGNGSGTLKVHLNGNQTAALDLTDLDTQSSANAYCTQFELMTSADIASVTYYFDDLILMDGIDATATQLAPLNGFLGDVMVDEKLPDGAGDSTQWTPSAGANYECVDETPRNDDTDYVSSSTVGQKDLYSFPDLTATTGAVKALLLAIRARKDDAGTRTIKGKVKHGGVEGNGPDTAMTTSYAYSYPVFGKNPSTAADWAIAEVNAMQGGVEVVA